MKTKDEHKVRKAVHRAHQRGNALVYVLIAIALFAALSFTLSRQTDSEQGSNLESERTKFHTIQIASYATQAKSAIDQMLLTGTNIDDLDFTLPSDPTFDVPPNINKVFHPEGGGLNLANINRGIMQTVSINPSPGWYMGRFNNVDWTDTTAQDVFLVAYQINEEACAELNRMITGSTDIPVLGDAIKDVMIDDEYFTGSNTDFTTDSSGICPECENMTSLCVQNQAQNIYGFYTILADQ